MNQISNKIQPSSLVDQENASISYSETTQRLQASLMMQGSTTPFSHIRKPKYRKLFDRHKIAYRH